MKNYPYYDDESCAFHSQVWKRDDPKTKSENMAEFILQTCYNFLLGEVDEKTFKCMVMALSCTLMGFTPSDVQGLLNYHGMRRYGELLEKVDLSKISGSEKADKAGDE